MMINKNKGLCSLNPRVQLLTRACLYLQRFQQCWVLLLLHVLNEHPWSIRLPLHLSRCRWLQIPPPLLSIAACWLASCMHARCGGCELQIATHPAGRSCRAQLRSVLQSPDLPESCRCTCYRCSFYGARMWPWRGGHSCSCPAGLTSCDTPALLAGSRSQGQTNRYLVT